MKTNRMKTKNYINFGKCALITGASGLLGKKHAEALLEIGTSVVLTDINLDLLKKTKEELENANVIFMEDGADVYLEKIIYGMQV
mgnify:CR=1 FL=1